MPKYAAIGTDGVRDVVWGVGETPDEARACAELRTGECMNHICCVDLEPLAAIYLRSARSFLINARIHSLMFDQADGPTVREGRQAAFISNVMAANKAREKARSIRRGELLDLVLS